MQRLCIAMWLMGAACGPVSSAEARKAPTTTLGTPDPQASNEVPADDMDCRNEVRTGTHLERKVCRSAEEKEMDRRKVEELIFVPIGYPHRF